MQEIELSSGNVALVDDQDYEWLKQFRWQESKGYAQHTWREVGRRKSVRMHRLILNPPAHLEIDHIDRNKLNNQRANLRLATHSQNGMNQTKYKNNTSGYKGVSWDKSKNKWQTKVQNDGKRIHVGYFDNVFDAARAYNEKAAELFGVFASLNEIQESFDNDEQPN